jgi:DNA-binding response OmpR family regulator
MPQNGTQGRILVVEDDVHNGRIMLLILRRAGYEAEVAADASAAFAAIATNIPSLILLDAQLPSMNGFDVCRALRDRDETRHTPIVFLTGTDTDQLRTKAREAGANDFIGKPYRTDELLDRLRTLLIDSQHAAEIEAMGFRPPRSA